MVSVLLALVEQIAKEPTSPATTIHHAGSDHDEKIPQPRKESSEVDAQPVPHLHSAHSQDNKVLVRKLRIQVSIKILKDIEHSLILEAGFGRRWSGFVCCIGHVSFVAVFILVQK